MVPLWVTVLASLGAGTVIGSLLQQFFQFWHNKQVYNQQMQREREAHERELKDAKRERVRVQYAVLLGAVETFMDVMFEYDVIGRLLETNSKSLDDPAIAKLFNEDRERQAARLRKALKQINEAMVFLTLDYPVETDNPSNMVIPENLRFALREFALEAERGISLDDNLPKEKKSKKDTIALGLIYLRLTLPKRLAEL